MVSYGEHYSVERCHQFTGLATYGHCVDVNDRTALAETKRCYHWGEQIVNMSLSSAMDNVSVR